jgi:hypothetical protein
VYLFYGNGVLEMAERANILRAVDGGVRKGTDSISCLRGGMSGLVRFTTREKVLPAQRRAQDSASTMSKD